MMSFLDKLHHKTCGSYSVVFMIARPFLTECPCCSFYRGIGIGALLAGVVAWAV